MPRQPTAKRYAQAVFQLAQERDALDAWLGQLVSTVESLSDRELLGYLEAPKVRLSEKVAALERSLSGVDPLLRNLAGLLVQRDTLRLIPRVALEYQRLLDAHHGRERAEVLTAVPVEEQQERGIQEHLADLVSKQVILTARVEPSIVGGMVARIGDRIIDGSTRTRLQELRKSLAGAG